MRSARTPEPTAGTRRGRRQGAALLVLLHLRATRTASILHARRLPWQYAPEQTAREPLHKEPDMQLLSSTASRLRQAVARGWRALADVHRNLVHVRERYYRYYRPSENGPPRAATTAACRPPPAPRVARPGRTGASKDAAGTRRPSRVRSRRSRRMVIAMQRYKYQALVTLSPSEDGGFDAEPPRLVRRLAVRPCHRETHRSELFSALVTAADGSPLKPGAAGGS